MSAIVGTITTIVELFGLPPIPRPSCLASGARRRLDKDIDVKGHAAAATVWRRRSLPTDAIAVTVPWLTISGKAG